MKNGGRKEGKGVERETGERHDRREGERRVVKRGEGWCSPQYDKLDNLFSLSLA